MLEEGGFQAEELSAQGKLSVIGADKIETAVPQLLELIHSPRSNGGVIRIVGNAAGWEQMDDEDRLILHEGELDRALATCAVIAICPYRTRGISSRTICHGALRNHASVIVDNAVKDNPFYRPLG